MPQDARIDLNADVGELPERLGDGSEAALFSALSSANIACGGHAGDAATMTAALRLARQHGVAAGAHPSYPDRAGFGRRALPLSPAALADTVAAQVGALAALARAEGVALTHVKPHGALYHAVSADPVLAAAFLDGVARVSRALILVGMAGAPCLARWRDAGFRAAGEAFADRRYEPDGGLRARTRDGAVLETPAEVAAQALELVLRGRVRASTGTAAGADESTWLPVRAETLCVHGDTPGAAGLAAALRAALLSHGVRVAPLVG